MYIYCVKRFAHMKCYSDYSCRGSHLVEPLCYGVVPSLFCTCVAWVCLLLYKEEDHSPVSLQLLRDGIWAV